MVMATIVAEEKGKWRAANGVTRIFVISCTNLAEFAALL
jgi:hypothetical protein